MLKSTQLIAFVATTDPERSKAFYRDVLGLELIADEAFAVVFQAGDTMLRIQKAQDFKPQPFTALGWRVDEIRPVIDQLRAKGVKFKRYDFFEQDAFDVWTTPDGSEIAWFEDPDGNTLSLTAFAKV
ncbi:MAG: VOC family protein [Polyangiaceae bacterium]|nr:VOC family protein [Myxococcales bacterium]MCB9585107.1 VOC family protein [Polyangiaceae bacterium]